MQNLPHDIVAHVCKFLTGFDGFNLSHVNIFWSNYFSDELFWCERIGEVKNESWSWKKQYTKARSMAFQGLIVGHRPDDVDSFSCFLVYRNRISLPHFTVELMGNFSFSFDVWFSLLPATEDRHFGGILLGLQSSSRESRQWPHYHQQFAMVSSKGELYCSVLSGKQVVANNLEANRWYHLALSYEIDNKQQKVYLDGREISCMKGPRHHEWYHLRLAQVGTGCITSDTLHCPYKGYIGWYGFHGVVDAFRLWKGKLSHNDVNMLVTGREVSTIPVSPIHLNVFAIAQVATMTTVAMSLEKLPLDITELICKFLTGFDGLHLSHVNTYWSRYFLDESFWRERVGGVNCQWSWKKKFVRCFSTAKRTSTLPSYNKGRDSRPHFQLELYSLRSFSLDVWLSLLPATKDQHFGGILLDMQSSSRESGRWPNTHQQFAMVSSKGELYCSVLSGKQVVATLEANRWYHLALSYENDSETQKVYLNSKEISSMVGNREWHSLTYVQVGTGCVTSDTLDCPYPGSTGWYGFHGVIDAFRVWGELSQENVNVLATGGEIWTIPHSGCAASTGQLLGKMHPTTTMQLMK